ncbi:hypothetical protein RHSIM_Rhsim03G0177400 [Rhododendron simsii]|uniref:Uncharacterized protein n=1 Tax=Rhododendron simsii TaxID=118357 RepID=A0A834HC57_RHOSS|nr:hypothetical protein RHSIM_Rhsim03G0177400 [Rhododendron simsii]
MASKLRSLVTNLMYLPVPTIAAVTGHASAADSILALSYDCVRREVLLRAAKYLMTEAAAEEGMGVVEAVEGGSEEMVAAAVRLGEELVNQFQRSWISLLQ